MAHFALGDLVLFNTPSANFHRFGAARAALFANGPSRSHRSSWPESCIGSDMVPVRRLGKGCWRLVLILPMLGCAGYGHSPLSGRGSSARADEPSACVRTPKKSRLQDIARRLPRFSPTL